MKKEMLINVLQPEECRIAILEDGVLEELYVERTSHESYVGNIYKGRIVNIEPSIQAAFVDFGVGRNGFLHVSDVEPAYYRHLEQRRPERGNNERRGRDRHRGGPSRPPRSEGRPPRRDDTESQLAEDLDRILGPAPAGQSEGDNELGYDQAFGPDLETHDTSDTARADTATPAGDLEPVQTEKVSIIGDTAATKSETPTEEAAEGDPTKGRRRGRGRGRGRGRSRRRGGAAERGGDEGSPQQSAEGSEKPVGQQAEAADLPKPRLMESAERRTDEDDAPNQPITPSSSSDDDLLFFPKDEPAPSAHEERSVATREPEPVEPAYEEARYEESSDEAAHEETPSTEALAGRGDEEFDVH